MILPPQGGQRSERRARATPKIASLLQVVNSLGSRLWMQSAGSDKT